MARLKASEKQDAARRGLEKLVDSGNLSRAQERKARRLLGNKRAMRRFAEDVELSILRDEGEDTPILDKLTAIIDWIIANQDKIQKIISIIMALFSV
jgi:hypothetical protein